LQTSRRAKGAEKAFPKKWRSAAEINDQTATTPLAKTARTQLHQVPSLRPTSTSVALSVDMLTRTEIRPALLANGFTEVAILATSAVQPRHQPSSLASQ
jgi:hypothetical protein